jgi:GTPase SAR1 family protein
MTKRYLVGGPKGSGKSTLVLSLVEHLRQRGLTAVALELDQWSDSYRAIKGEIADTDRRKRFDLKWPWEDALAPLIEHFNHGTEDIIFGDMPGVLGVVNSCICALSAPDGAIIVSKSIEGIKDWRRFFKDDFGITIAHTILSVQGMEPTIILDTNRRIDPNHPHVVSFTNEMLRQPKSTDGEA